MGSYIMMENWLWGNGVTNMEDTGFNGLFNYWDGKQNSQPAFRFGFYDDKKYLSWGFLTGNKGSSGVSYLGPQCFDSVNFWNQRTAENTIEFNEDTYLAIIIDPSKTEKKSGKTLDGKDFNDNLCIRQDIFIGDKKVLSGWYNKAAWDLMVEKKLNTLTKFCLGECSMGSAQKKYFSHMDCYSLRFYNRALTDDEIHESYEKTKEYHKILEDKNKKSVN